jgi:hypothetical protein
MTPEGAVAALNTAIEKLNASLPPDYRIEVRGTVEESGNSRRSVFARVPLMLFLMITFSDDPVAEFLSTFPGSKHRSDGPCRDYREDYWWPRCLLSSSLLPSMSSGSKSENLRHRGRRRLKSLPVDDGLPYLTSSWKPHPRRSAWPSHDL